MRAVAARHGLPGEYLLFVGTLEPRKNVDGLLRALAALPQASRRWCWPGGAAGCSTQTQSLITELGLGGRVHLREDFPADDLPALYSGAAALVLPSHYEGFGLPALEAMACGTPVVIADRASLPEIAGEAALRVQPNSPASIAQAIERVLTDTVCRETLTALGLERVKQFSWRRTAEQTLAVYRRVLA